MLMARADALKRLSAARRRARTAKSGGNDAASVGYLYVPCVRTPDTDDLAEARRWVQEVPIVKKTAKWIYYTSDTWDRGEAIVSPGRISREDFETDTRCRGPAGRQFFATREAAEADLAHRERERVERAAREAPPIKDLRRAMADAHPDRGGTAERFIEARHRYETALRSTRR
jgi:hypothetical protein